MVFTRMVAKVALVVGVLALGAPALGVSAGTPPGYPPGGNSNDDSNNDYSLGPLLVAYPNPVGTGMTFELTAFVCSKGDVIPITFEGRTVKATCTNPHAKASFTAPTKVGTYTATAVMGGVTLQRTVIVVAATAGSGLPNTGSSNPNLLISIGVSIVLTGGLATFVIRRRRPATA